VEPAHPKSTFEALAGPRYVYQEKPRLAFASFICRVAGGGRERGVRRCPQVPTQHNDLQRTGANLAETSLSPEAVSAHGLTKLGSYRVTEKVFAQPLFITRNGRHNLYVATAANFVYDFDADAPGSGPLATADLGSDRVVPSRDVYQSATDDEPADIPDGLGIISTPVIDLQTATLYCVAMTKFPDAEKNRHHGNPYVWTLHALDLDTLHEKAQVEIWHPRFDPHKQLERASLTLVSCHRNK
jgi:hypothetical protein